MGGYRAGVSNPLIWFNGESYVWARFERDACVVFTGPVYPIELQTHSTLAEAPLADHRSALDVGFRRRNYGRDTIVK